MPEGLAHKVINFQPSLAQHELHGSPTDDTQRLQGEDCRKATASYSSPDGPTKLVYIGPTDVLQIIKEGWPCRQRQVEAEVSANPALPGCNRHTAHTVYTRKGKNERKKRSHINKDESRGCEPCELCQGSRLKTRELCYDCKKKGAKLEYMTDISVRLTEARPYFSHRDEFHNISIIAR